MIEPSSIHASCVLVGGGAVLIRGPSGSGKSRLVLQLLQAAERGDLPFARLVSDDRTRVEAVHGRLLARPAPELAGLLELRHIGIRSTQNEPMAVVNLVIDRTGQAQRLPDDSERTTEIAGITLPRLALPALAEALPLILAKLLELAIARREALSRRALSEK
jgi:serine kinase of HPr protein (carbohydrate metabolism regulator)